MSGVDRDRLSGRGRSVKRYINRVVRKTWKETGHRP